MIIKSIKDARFLSWEASQQKNFLDGCRNRPEFAEQVSSALATLLEVQIDMAAHSQGILFEDVLSDNGTIRFHKSPDKDIENFLDGTANAIVCDTDIDGAFKKWIAGDTPKASLASASKVVVGFCNALKAKA